MSLRFPRTNRINRATVCAAIVALLAWGMAFVILLSISGCRLPGAVTQTRPAIDAGMTQDTLYQTATVTARDIDSVRRDTVVYGARLSSFQYFEGWRLWAGLEIRDSTGFFPYRNPRLVSYDLRPFLRRLLADSTLWIGDDPADSTTIRDSTGEGR